MGPGEQVTMPKGTMTGGASAGDANALAQMIVNENNNAMAGFDRVNGQLAQMQATETQSLKTSQEALAKLEQLSNQQGSGETRCSSPKARRASTRSRSSASSASSTTCSARAAGVPSSSSPSAVPPPSARPRSTAG
jgi:hypothetical protein